MIIRNKSATRDYELHDSMETGIVLEGQEVKALRTQGGRLDGAYVKVIGGEVWLVGAHIPRYAYAPKDDAYDPARRRKLLVHKKELLKTLSKLDQLGHATLVPLSIHTKGRRFKVEIAIGKGRKSWQKKRVDQERSEKKRVEKEIKEHLGR